jgi:alkanesulfonate monooxygenase SsuD/methylene tetrahydromethanopterin reductase-like flavin-dependent oxidoreductase (luciferase family)
MTGMHLAVALEDAGWHPAAWREPDARPDALFTAGYWVEEVREAARGLLDFVTFADTVTLQPAGPGGRVRGRMDAALLAARVAPTTAGIGIVPAVDTALTEPFLVSTQIATLDFVSRGRAGWEADVSVGREADAYVGPRPVSSPSQRYDEARDHVEVVRRLWDSWEDGAEIRDAANHRFLDVTKVHRIDFESPHFAVVGPSITPRSPQAQPLVATRADDEAAASFARHAADVAFVAARDERELATHRARLGGTLLLADLVVFLDEDEGTAHERRARLDGIDRRDSDTLVFAGTPGQLATHLSAWRDAGADGFRLHPATRPHDLRAITRRLVPELQARGAFRRAYEADTLRGLLGLARPANRYALA